ncbi:hypothetical protein, partial [Akkermansia sp.]
SPFSQLYTAGPDDYRRQHAKTVSNDCGTKRKPVISGNPYGNFQDIAKPNFLKTFFFQFCRLDSGFQIRPFYNPVLTNKLFFII